MIEIGEITYRFPSNGKHIGLHDGRFRKKKQVKVGICEKKNVTEREIEGLLELGSNNNIQKLYGYSDHDSKWFLALEMFDITLEEHISKPIPERLSIDPVSLIKGITNGLNYLHDLKIVHGSVSGKNIGICNLKKCAKICIAFEDAQKNVNLILTQPPVGENLYKKDVNGLCNVIAFILSETMDCDAMDLYEKMKELNDMKSNADIFLKWIYVKGSNLNYRSLLKLSLLRQVAAANYDSALSTNSILHHPIFWKNKEKFEKIKKIAGQWKNESQENIALINQMGRAFLTKCKWITKLKCQNKNQNPNIGNEMTKLVNFVVSQMKYYQHEDKNGVLRHEHMLYFLEKLPYLLTFMIMADNMICDKKRETNENCFLHKKFTDNNLPTRFLIAPNDITKSKLIKISNAEVYDGIYKKSGVALKRIPKMDFKLNELRSIINLKSRPGTSLTCKGCDQNECQNIIGFHGCYETDEFVWIVMEKAKEDFKDFKFTNQEVKLQILFDAVKGLECLHANSISHLDIKPGNILVVERNKKLVGCLADFGESIDAIKKTYTRSKIRGTDGYIAPELAEAFNRDQKTRSNNKKRFILNYSKCDIYSLGMVIKKDYLNSIDKKESLDMNLMICEELVNFMTEKDPTSRPDVEAVRKNPFFWDVTQKLKFLEHVHEYGDGHTTDPDMKKRIENMIRNRKNWVNSLKQDDKMTMEIEKYMKKKRKEQKGAEESIFALVEFILFIVSYNCDKLLHKLKIIISFSNVA
ncbi:hypothetical protein ACKWTF_014663 [Chironomus riparius]